LKQSALAFLLLVVAASTTSPTQAEDFKAFDGLYVGLHGGYAWEKISGLYGLGTTQTNLGNIDLDSALVGGQLGYNVQLGNFVMGVEADASGFVGSDSVTNDPGAATPLLAATDDVTILSANLSYLASIRGRIGYVVGDVLLYGTAGIGFVEFDLNANTPTLGFDQTLRRRDVGGVYGGGLEWNLVEGVTLRGEYLHYDVKASSGIPSDFPNSVSGNAVNFHDIDVARAGINISLSP
jgi:outer membrane immunogenic protein